MLRLHPEFDACVRDIRSLVEPVEGWLTERELELLALLAALSTAEGEILEIGSFRGKSTIVLSKAASLTGGDRVVAVDPLTYRPPTESAQNGGVTARDLLDANLKRAGVYDQVEFHQTYSCELAKTWDRPIQLLWIDGDHSYRGTKLDFDLFSPYLVDGAMIAFHDILAPCDSIRVFRGDILESPFFGPVGMCGSIGWARYSASAERCRRYHRSKQKLARRLAPLVGYDASNFKGPNKVKYRFHRLLVPHRRIPPARLLRQVA